MNFQNRIIAFYVVAMLGLFLPAVSAGQYNKPYEFYPDTVAKASEVNQNFDVLYNAVNSLSTSVGDVSSKVDSVSSSISGVPKGVILMWSGSTSSIPSGWVLCNGKNGTPDLRNRFIVGSGSSYNVNATGGKTTNNLTHTHHVDFNTGAPKGNATDSVEDGKGDHVAGDGHHHDVIGNTGGAQNNTYTNFSSVENRPPYYGLYFIMKL